MLGLLTVRWPLILLGPALALLAAGPAFAADAQAAPLQVSQPSASWDYAARELMNQGRLDDAAMILDARLTAQPNDVQARFLKGMIAVAKNNNPQAIRIFRSILIDEPKAGRVRLELARAFFLAKDYGNALRQFQFALAGDPPPEVAANIGRYMAAIRDAKTVSYNFGIAIAPDSNLNTGSTAREVTLFGLPFDLSEDARQRSGVGLALEAGGEWAPRIGEGKRLRLGLSGQRREYSGSDFDDMTIAGYAGPRLVVGRLDLSLLGTGYKRWYGASPYNQAIGGRAEATYHLSPRLAVSGAASAQWVRHRHARERDGRLASVNAGAFHALTSSSGVTAKAGISRHDARIAPYSSWSGFAAAGYYRDLPMGFSVYVEPAFSFSRYDEALVGFGRRRSDRTQTVLVTLLNRHLVLTRLTPRIAYTFTRQTSTIPLYEFTRSRIEIGFTSTF